MTSPAQYLCYGSGMGTVLAGAGNDTLKLANVCGAAMSNVIYRGSNIDPVAVQALDAIKAGPEQWTARA